MILSLRQRHRRTFAVLGVLLPIALAVGIAARRAVPQSATLPPELSSTTQTFTATEYQRDDLFAKADVKVRLWRDLGSGQLAVGFMAPKDFLKPDLIVYWIAGQPKVTDELPSDAVLLGSFVAGPLALPADSAAKEGLLILFSLANQEIVRVSEPFVAANVSSRQTSLSQAGSEVSRRLTSAATNK